MKLRSNILKLALFATGLAGIVAEYVLSTLATYFLGDSVFQWTMIVSIMLFSMGLGSRISRIFKDEAQLLKTFILIEFALSLLSSNVSLITYTVSAYSVYTGFAIYSMSILIGLLIGMEIPLVIRLNDAFEELRVNIASVMEKDYYGSLVGGVFYAFFGLPLLGLTYTPFVLGGINFIVALAMLFMLWPYINAQSRKLLAWLAVLVSIVLIAGVLGADFVVRFGEQKRYADKVIYSEQSRYQRIVITQSKGEYYLFINGNEQLSTIDDVMYHEPLVHPPMLLHGSPQSVLVLGGGDGCAVRELLKYPDLQEITMVDLDPAMTRLAREHPVMQELNQGALDVAGVEIINQDAYTWLSSQTARFDVIIIDLPDPKTIELGRLYSYEFYKLCFSRLRESGIIITQAGSPYYAPRAFYCIEKTMQAAGFSTLPLHNQVLTLGEWGWVMGARDWPQGQDMRKAVCALSTGDLPMRWLTDDAFTLIASFGKPIMRGTEQTIAVNRIHDPVLDKYYRKADWDLY